ncbi:MAG TPA: hypothetical protein DCO68_04790 [Methylophilaceae bacterium]|nr:hypothetical protein [Methylophilaceae bacterium]
MALVSLRAYARHRGVNLSAVQKAISSNRITLIDGKIDPNVADIQWAQNTRPDQQERGSLKDFEKTQADLAAMKSANSGNNSNEAGTSGLSVEKAETESIRRQLMELQLAERRGELVNVADIERAMAAKLIDARTALSNMAHELAPNLAAETDILKIKMMLQKKINTAMSSLTQEAPENTQ